MYHHQGKNRTNKENIQIAVVLSFVAGIVNVAGFLAFGRLTTNITGHFAFFIYDISVSKFWEGLVFFLYIFSFLLGSFLSGFLIETSYYKKRINIYLYPTLLECFLLFFVVLSEYFYLIKYNDIKSCLLLLAMGVQNSFVTRISKSIVRTTHITGLVTDLGIELSQLLYIKKKGEILNIKKLKFNIRLRFFIVCFFFLGGFTSGILYIKGVGIYVLLLAIMLLLLGLFYDSIRLTYLTQRRKHRDKLHYKKIQSR